MTSSGRPFENQVKAGGLPGMRSLNLSGILANKCAANAKRGSGTFPTASALATTLPRRVSSILAPRVLFFDTATVQIIIGPKLQVQFVVLQLVLV